MKYIAGLYVYSEGLCLLLKIIKAGLWIESSQISHPFTKQLSDFANSSGKHMRRRHCLRNCILGFCWVMIKLMTGTFHKQLPSQGYALRHNGGKRRHLHLGHPLWLFTFFKGVSVLRNRLVFYILIISNLTTAWNSFASFLPQGLLCLGCPRSKAIGLIQFSACSAEKTFQRMLILSSSLSLYRFLS